MKKNILATFIFLFSLTSFAQKKSETELRMEKAGFIEVQVADPSIKVDLMYAKSNNFTGKLLYTDLHHAYLHPQAMNALKNAQKELKRLHPDYSLIIYDAARPMSVQQRMWDVVKSTPKAPYVSNPKNGGGLHNYGLAVDITIVDEKGNLLPMGTKVDHLGKEAHIDTETAMVQRGTITRQEQKNRELLRRVMKDAGFKPLRTEWWHFNFKSRAQAKAYYQVIR